MPLTVATLLHSVGANGSTNITSTPGTAWTNGKFVWLAVMTDDPSGQPTAHRIQSAAGVNQQSLPLIGSPITSGNRYVSVYGDVASISSAVTPEIYLDFPTSGRHVVYLFQSDADVTEPIVTGSIVSGSDTSVEFNTPASNDNAFWFAALGAESSAPGSGHTVESGWTLHAATDNTNSTNQPKQLSGGRVCSDGDNTCSPLTFSGITGTTVIWFGFELQFAAGGAGSQSISPGTTSTGESVPSPQLNIQVLPGTTSTGESVPNPALNQQILPGTTATGESIPNPQLNIQVLPGTTATGESVPNPTLTQGLTILPDATATGESVPNPTLIVGSVTISPGTIATGESVPNPQLNIQVLPGTTSTGESVPNPTLALLAISIRPDTTLGGMLVYAPQLNLTIYPGTVASGLVVREPSVGEFFPEPFPETVPVHTFAVDHESHRFKVFVTTHVFAQHVVTLRRARKLF